MLFRRSVLACAAFTLASLAHGRAIAFHASRADPADLAVTGLLAGVPPGETRYLRRADLSALPSTKLKLSGEFLPGEQEVTVVFLADLWASLPRAEGADTLLATCADGYVSVFRREFITDYRPFLILEINGRGPADWPPPGLTFNPGPYVIGVSPDIVPAVAQVLDLGHKKPWGVTTVEVARHESSFAPFFAGRWAAPSPRAAQGREIWINSCASCHRGPPGTFSGFKSDRPFELLTAHAVHNPDFFKRYVRDPKSLVPAATMEPHAHYTDAQLEALIAFLAAPAKK